MPSNSKRRATAHALNFYEPRQTLPYPFEASLTPFTPIVQPLQSEDHASSRKRQSQPPYSELELSPPLTRPPSGKRSSTHELGTFVPSKFLFAPADTPPAYTPTASSPPPARFSALKSKSSPLLHSSHPSSPYGHHPRRMSAVQLHSESDSDDGNDAGIGRVITSSSTGNLKATGAGVRARIFGIGSSYASTRHRDRPKTICTTPGALCAGETETEVDEPPKHLPTARIIPSSGPLVPPNTLQQRLTPLLFEFSRLLSIVPAVFGTLYNLYHVFKPPPPRADVRSSPERVDFAISALWAVLTGWQCLCLTTGLLTRWRLYYPPLSTLIRLLALQGICWPATQLTCTILEHQKRPVIVWAVIGTTTCVSRGVQIWVTSNLWWETREMRDRNRNREGERGEGEEKSRSGSGSGYWKRWGGGKWGGRRWDWKEVGVKYWETRNASMYHVYPRHPSILEDSTSQPHAYREHPKCPEEMNNKIFHTSTHDPRHDPGVAIVYSSGYRHVVDAAGGCESNGSDLPPIRRRRLRPYVYAGASLPQDVGDRARPKGRVSPPTSGARPKPSK
ncbi:putative N-glycosylation protein [Lyophyllum shimeji]|uniref:N-glycosylation protein n=1 Tax=Lyophyllum shimeji TaxID=47721 RepID=A0A9P3PW94_LYOSH|nr:putative N-glycosylation protein [Lyophyllum shimeji]